MFDAQNELYLSTTFKTANAIYGSRHSMLDQKSEAVADTDMWISIIFMSIKLIYDDYWL